MQSSSTAPTSTDSSGSLNEGINLLGENFLELNTIHQPQEGDDEETQRQSQQDESSCFLSADDGSTSGAGNNAGSESATETIKMGNANTTRSEAEKSASANNPTYIYGSMGSMAYSASHPKLTNDSPSQSPTSSLGNSEDTDAFINGKVNKQTRSIQRNTIDALKDGGMMIVKDESRNLSFLLFSVVLICTLCMTILATSNANNSYTFYKDHKVDSSSDGGNTINTEVSYFPLPDGTKLSFDGDGSAPFDTSKYVPFPTVDRKDYSVPASDIVFPELFHSSLKHNSDETKGTPGPKPYLKVPFPTGAFWTNLVVRPTPDQGLSSPVMAYPYGYKWNPSGMQVSYPPLRRVSSDTAMIDIFYPDLTLGTKEAIGKRNVVRWDPLSVKLRFYGGGSTKNIEDDGEPDPATPYWESYLVQGQPYVTAKYNKMIPVLDTLTNFANFVCPRDSKGNFKDDASDTSVRNDVSHFGVCSLSDQTSASGGVTLQGVQFLVKTGDNITWMLFASEPITLTVDGRNIVSTEKFSGVLRFAILPPPLDEDGGSLKKEGGKYEDFPLSTSLGVKRLIYHAHTYPVGAKISWDFKDIPTTPSYNLFNANGQEVVNSVQDLGAMMEGVTVGSVKFLYDTKSMQGDEDAGRGSQASTQESLLMLALPHHAQVLPSNMILKDLDLKYQSIKGTMTPIVGSKWVYDEHLTKTGFDDHQSLKRLQSLDSKTKKFILNQVEKDLRIVLPNLKDNVYGFGKAVARLANLGHIASVLEDHQPDASSTSLTRRATDLLHNFLTKFLDNMDSDNLVYDLNFGGIITRNGLIDQGADFGNGWYNDHHFHYGYIMYACAFLGRQNSTFVDEYGTHVDSLMYDVAHGANTNSDVRGGAFFPFTRHKSWFDGHSFASGLFPFGNGKSQESSSEAVNCYYGAYLWSSIRWKDADGGDKMINFAKLLLAMEIRGAKTYWHMLSPQDADGMDSIHSKQIYSKSLSKSLMVGNVGMTDALVSTWFGSKSVYVHMINFMPVTAITKELFTVGYVEEEFNEILKPIYDTVENAWRGYVISDRALIEPNEAWKDAIKLKSYELDSALSLSQLYYWIGSMENFNSSVPTDFDENGSLGVSYEEASCDNHKGCVGLSGGLCCPTLDGTSLDCCDLR